MIRTVTPADAAAIAEIYNYYVLQTTISFEEAPVSADDIAQRIQQVMALHLPWLVCEIDGVILGYAYANKWKERSAYRYAVESSIYLRNGISGKGLGSALYERMLADLRMRGKHTVIGGVTLPNEASVRIHEKFGFEPVARFKEVGKKFGRWLDVGYWQLQLNDAPASEDASQAD